MPTRPPQRPPGFRNVAPRGQPGYRPGVAIPPDLAYFNPPGEGGGGPGGASVAGLPGPEAPAVPRTMQVFPPEYFPIVGAQEFRVNQSFASPAAGTIEPPALVTQIPDRYIGILRVFGYGLLNMTAATDVTWRLLVNGGPVAGYEFRFFPGNVPRVNATEDIYLRLPMGARVSLAFQNVDGAVYTAGAQWSGWFWQPSGAQAWTGGEYNGG